MLQKLYKAKKWYVSLSHLVNEIRTYWDADVSKKGIKIRGNRMNQMNIRWADACQTNKKISDKNYPKHVFSNKIDC